MKRPFSFLVVAMLLVSACDPSRNSPSPSALPTVQTSGAISQPPTAEKTILPSVPPTKARVPTATPTNSVLPTRISPLTAGSTELALGSQKIRLDGEDMQVVPEPEYTLTGQAPAGTVISVNDDFMVVGTDLRFNFPLSLEEGPNLIEFEASDAQGQSVTLGLVIIYDPSSN